MTARAVKTYVAQYVQLTSTAGLAWPLLTGFSQWPKTDTPCMAVVGTYRRREKRLRGPRGAGTKQIDYELQVLIQGALDDPQVGGDDFDTLVENVCTVFRSRSPGMVNLVDNKTGETSVLSDIGEDVDVDTLLPESDDDPPTLVTHRAILTLKLQELMQPA